VPGRAKGPAIVERTRSRGLGSAARATKYIEFHGGVRLHTYISRRAVCTHRECCSGWFPQAGATHGEVCRRKIRQLVKIQIP
jgi:hypothetical protein